MKELLWAGGVHSLAFAFFHLAFRRIFGWERALPKLDFVNQRVYRILNLCLIFVFFWIAYVSLFHADELLLIPGLGKAFTGGVAIFWILRAAEQVWLFPLKPPLSAGLLALFVLGAILYGVPTFLPILRP